MSYYIIIRGPLGVGKSTIATKLASELHAEYISIDKVLKDLKLDGVPKTEETIPLDNFKKADETLFPKVREALAKKKIVIFDGCFQHQGHIAHLEQNLPGKHYIFTLTASLESCIERDSKRSRVYGPDAARAVYNITTRFTAGIPIDTTGKSISESLAEIKNYLPKK